MRIDLSVPDPSFSRPLSVGSISGSESASFTGLLDSLLAPELKSSGVQAHQMSEQAGSNPLNILSLRQESYLAAIYANQENVERLLEDWEERSPHAWLENALEDELSRQESHAEGCEASESASGCGEAEATDLTLEPDLSSGEYMHFSSADQGCSDPDSEPRHQSARVPEVERTVQPVQEQELSYAELQALVDSVLLSERTFSYKVRQILNRILQGLSEGQVCPLDQHVLLELEAPDWRVMAELFPPRFFQGLLRPLMCPPALQSGKLEEAYGLIEHIFYQQGPLRPEQFEQLEAWWGQVTPLPGMFVSWLRQPELPALSLADLFYPVEILYQHQALLPGATGRIQALALQYAHHPETALKLFEISRTILHSQPLSGAQIKLLSEKLADFCFPRALFVEGHMVPLLERALSGDALEQVEILQLLQGAPQKILSHLPYAQLSESLREIIHFIHADPDWTEDNILKLFLENEPQI
jgi:hypothetical protein